VFERILKLKH